MPIAAREQRQLTPVRASARVRIPVVLLFVCLHSKKILEGRGTRSRVASLSAAQIFVNSFMETAMVACSGKGVPVGSRILQAAVLSLPCLLFASASVDAKDAPSSFWTWLNRVTRTGAHHRQASSPPLPKARPAELGSAAVAPNEREAVKPNKTSEAIPD